MVDKKPNVFPTGGAPNGQPNQAPAPVPAVTQGEMSAAQEMLERTQVQLKAREEALRNSPELQVAPIEALSYEQLAQAQSMAQPVHQTMMTPPIIEVDKKLLEVDKLEREVEVLSRPKWESAFDVIPIPSKGKTYKGVKSSIKVAYMTGSDENILTSANLLESGNFLKVLISRNLLEENLKYDDLLLGDRNAIIIWLRGSSFGNIYPITIVNNKGVAEDFDFDLNDLKYIYMEKDPDENGCFDFTCPQSGDLLKYRYLTVRDEDFIEESITRDEKTNSPINHRSTYTLQRQIAAINGDTNVEVVHKAINNMRLADLRAFRTFYNENESGVNLNIKVQTGGGDTVSTFLPFNLNFFWTNT